MAMGTLQLALWLVYSPMVTDKPFVSVMQLQLVQRVMIGLAIRRVQMVTWLEEGPAMEMISTGRSC